MSNDQHPTLIGFESEPLAEYRVISRSAIAACGLGLLSILAWLHPLSWVIPVVGILTSLWALRTTSDPAIGGRRLALAGLFFSLLFCVSAIANEWIERQIVYRYGRQFSDQFIELLQNGDLAQAVESTESFMYRQPDSVPLHDHYEQVDEAKRAMTTLRERPAVAAILAAGSTSPIQFERWSDYQNRSYRRACTFVYRIVADPNRPQLVSVEVARDADPEVSNEPHWRITELELIDSSAP